MASNVELLAQGIDAFNRGGIDAILPFYSADVVWLAPPEWIGQAEFVGHEGLRQLAEIWTDNFDEYRLELLEGRGSGDRVVAKLMQRGAIKGTSEVVEQRISWVSTYEDGLVRHVQAYFSWEEADAALSAAERAQAERS